LRGLSGLNEGVSAGLLDLLQVLRNQRKDSALIEVFAVDGALISGVGVFQKEGATHEDFAAGAAARAFALTAGEKFVVLCCVNVCSEEPPEFTGDLAGSKKSLLQNSASNYPGVSRDVYLSLWR
jgi:hypothetical protein